MKFPIICLTVIATVKSQTSPVNNLPLSVKEFMRFDANHDGHVTQSEWEAVLKTDDLNGDGIVSCDEYVRQSTSPKHIALAVLNQFDGGDCQLTHDEGMVPYHHMDKNGDGIVQEIEFESFYVQVLKHLGFTDDGHTFGK